MALKVKALEALEAANLLFGIISQGRDKEKTIPAKASYRLSRLAHALRAEAQIIEEKRVALIHKHGAEKMKTVGEGEEAKEVPTGDWFVPPEKMADYLNEWNPVANEVIEVQAEPLPITVFGEGESFFTIDEQIQLDKFLIAE